MKVKINILKKPVIYIFVIFFLVSMLYAAQNYSIDEMKTIFRNIYATKKAASSTKTTVPSTGSDMVELLARLINGEARGEPYLGQVAVGAVVMNRVKSPEFPNTISAVIYQKGQFSCVTDGQFDKPIDKASTVYKAAREALNGADPTNGALFFYNPKTAKSKWLYSLKTTSTIGRHRFAKGTK